jgi:hypothetical protein
MGIVSDQVEFSIDNFVNEFGGGSCSCFFIWDQPTFGPNDTAGISEKKKRMYLVKSSGFPATTIEEHNIEYQGLNFKMGGKKTFEDWNVTLLLDGDGKIRYDMEKWTNDIHGITEKGMVENFYFDNYKSDQTFKILRGNGKFSDPLMEVKLYGAWPKSISSIALEHGSSEFAQFEVTFAYQYHVIKKPTPSISDTFSLESFMDSISSKIKGLIGL